MNNRHKMLAKIHIAKKQLGMNDDCYREMLKQVAGVKSAKELDLSGFDKVLRHLKQVGFKARSKAQYPGRPHNADSQRQIKKIEALLADNNLSWKYADAIAARMFGIKKIAWCLPPQLSKIITALIKQHGDRSVERAGRTG